MPHGEKSRLRLFSRVKIVETREVASILPIRFAIVWLVLVRAFPPAANLFVLFGLEVAHEHVELDYSLLRRIVVLFFGRHDGC